MIAIAGPNLPHELLMATGRYAGPLAFDPEREIRRAAQWLESKFMPWAKCVLEAWANDEYGDLRQVLFSRADDTSQRLYYYISELQRRGMIGGPEPIILDIAKIPRPTSLERNIYKLRALAEALDVQDGALEQAIAAANVQRRAAEQNGAAGPPCLLAGTPPPDYRLHEVVERCGFLPIGPTLPENWAELGPIVDENSGDPCAAIGRSLHQREGGPRSFTSPAETLGEVLRSSAAQAVILWRIEEDEAQTWHLPSERRVLEMACIPALVLTRRDWLARDGAIQEIEAFLKEVTP